VTAPYRTPDLAAECDALRAEVAALRAQSARVPMRWQIVRDGSIPREPDTVATMLVAVHVLASLTWSVGFVAVGWREWTQRGAAVLIVAAALWALAVVRRVPVEGARP